MTAPDTTGGELRDDEWWTRLFLASSEAIDSVPYAAGPEYPVPHAAAFRSAVEPALRALLAERDTLAAQVQAVERLAATWESDAKRHDDAEPINSDGLTRMILAARFLRMNAADLRRALGTPTTGGGE